VPRPANQSPRTIVRLSVPIDVATHAKLCGLAALRQVDRSQIAANLIKAGLANVIVRAGQEDEPKTSELPELTRNGQPPR
jgi:hypothetical protein